MARKSKEQIERELLQSKREIEAETEKRLQAMLPGLMAGMMAELAKIQGGLGSGAAPQSGESKSQTAALLEGLAHAMAKASDPGNRRRIVAPEIMQERALANEEMKRAILTAHAKGEMPIYKVMRATQLNEMLIQPQFFDPITKAMKDQEIDWPSIPNQAMLPVNEPAMIIHAHYLMSIGARAGHVLMGFTKVGDDIEPRAVPLNELGAPVVLTGHEIRRGHAGAPTGSEMSISDALAFDPRRGSPGAKPRTQNILGTRAQPAVIG